MNLLPASFQTGVADSLSMPAGEQGAAAQTATALAGAPAKKAIVRKTAAKQAVAKKATAAAAPGATKKAAAAGKSKSAAPAATASPAKTGAAGKVPKKATKPRPRLVRDSFTMPEADFELIVSLKAKALDARRAAKKSELLRAGLRLLSGLEAKALAAALDKLEPVKIGRPKKGR
jgi:hypothetical protein